MTCEQIQIILFLHFQFNEKFFFCIFSSSTKSSILPQVSLKCGKWVQLKHYLVQKCEALTLLFENIKPWKFGPEWKTWKSNIIWLCFQMTRGSAFFSVCLLFFAKQGFCLLQHFHSLVMLPYVCGQRGCVRGGSHFDPPPLKMFLIYMHFTNNNKTNEATKRAKISPQATLKQ